VVGSSAVAVLEMLEIIGAEGVCEGKGFAFIVVISDSWLNATEFEPETDDRLFWKVSFGVRTPFSVEYEICTSTATPAVAARLLTCAGIGIESATDTKVTVVAPVIFMQVAMNAF
jgi:hypothetical protein